MSAGGESRQRFLVTSIPQTSAQPIMSAIDAPLRGELFMHRALRFALATELVLLLLERAVPVTHYVLPICGDHFSQLAILLLAAVIYVEVSQLRE